MKVFKLIAATTLATVMSFELSGCSLFGNKETQEESSQAQSEEQKVDQGDENSSEKSSQTDSSDKKTEEGSIVSLSNDPVDILLSAKEEVLSAEELDFTEKGSYTDGEQSGEYESNFRLKPNEIYSYNNQDQIDSKVIIKDNYAYRSAYNDKFKAKQKVSDEELSEYYEETKKAFEQRLEIFSRENIKEMKEESNDGNKKTYLVELNNKDDLKSGSDAVNVDDVKIKVVINNGVLSEMNFSDMKMTNEEKTITFSRNIIVNAIGSDVAAIEIPEDADSYEEIDLDDESDESDNDE